MPKKDHWFSEARERFFTSLWWAAVIIAFSTLFVYLATNLYQP
jgi:hypothetical protein